MTEIIRAAREIGREVQALLEGERQVEALLRGSDSSTDLQSNSNLESAQEQNAP